MDLDALIMKLNIKYYKSLKKQSDKDGIKLDWLNQHLEKIVSDTEKKDQQTESERKVEVLEITNKILTDNSIYKKSWIKLNSIHKILKIKEFVNELKIDSESERIKLRDELVQLVKNKVLTKKDKINYDEENGKIISITNLQYKSGNYYYNS
jgi:hypothetical protein